MVSEKSACNGGGRSTPATTMTPEELCRYDDICTALIIDPYMGFQTHKMNIRFRPLSNQAELKEIVEDFIEDQDYEKTLEKLLNSDPRRIGPLIRTEREKTLMRQHVFCFLKMFDKDAGFVIKPCGRYSAEENQGGKIVATKAWKKNEVISMLVGCIAELTAQQEKELLVWGQNDFSVMWSNRKKKSQLWLGPAAYMNHDCKPNCLFRPVGNTASLQVIRDISPGDEILLSYGESFFGVDNCCCECKTCEVMKHGAFKPKEDEVVEENRDRLRPVPSRISTRAERIANGTLTRGLEDNWTTRAQRLKTSLRDVQALKKRKVTRYDAEIIMEGNRYLPEPFRTPSVPVGKSSHTSSHKECAYTHHSEVGQESHIRTQTPSKDSSSSLLALAPQRGGQPACTPANPCVPRRQGKRTQLQMCKSRLKRVNHTVGVEEPRQAVQTSWSDKEGAERAPPPLLFANTCPEEGLKLSATELFPSPQKSVHCEVSRSFSPHSNGRLPVGKLLNKEPVRHSPRLRSRRCSAHSDMEGRSVCRERSVAGEVGEESGGPHPLEPSPLAMDLDNDDSGLGEMTGDVCDKSLDSNHNFHEPPVLEPQLPFLFPELPCSLSPLPHADDLSEQELNQSSSSSVPLLSFCGDPIADHDASPCPSPAHVPLVRSKKRKRKEPITLRIKLEHPDNSRKADFYQQIERDGESRYVKIEPKETLRLMCNGVPVKREGRGSCEAGEGHRSVLPKPSLPSPRCAARPALPPVKLKLRSDMWQSVV
ncbi:hypothetical protein ACOMHN_007626 [Nucella lapillus]